VWGRRYMSKGFGGGKLKVRDHLEELNVNETVVLKWKEAWAGLTWPGMVTSGGLL
jgi:hypothetical protein